ncbi:MoxR-like ATPases [Acetivibrio straminisolvens JCM 21531]|uniref:MoxR-like ATPases n=1 Tax=Acetivibrio straminisolvens JCM 21531 TaxID=1294263 RepID=W4VDK8_9FIRM|nr:MoxR-like ATPases [Acetivibrio straminisolvens JCM 21531]
MEILKRFKEENPLDKIEPVASEKEIIDAQKSYSKVYVSDDILKYIVDIAEKTRNHKDVIIGVSPVEARLCSKRYRYMPY